MTGNEVGGVGQAADLAVTANMEGCCNNRWGSPQDFKFCPLIFSYSLLFIRSRICVLMPSI